MDIQGTVGTNWPNLGGLISNFFVALEVVAGLNRSSESFPLSLLTPIPFNDQRRRRGSIMFSRALRVPRAAALRAARPSAAPMVPAFRTVTTNAASASLEKSVPEVCGFYISVAQLSSQSAAVLRNGRDRDACCAGRNLPC